MQIFFLQALRNRPKTGARLRRHLHQGRGGAGTDSDGLQRQNKWVPHAIVCMHMLMC